MDTIDLSNECMHDFSVSQEAVKTNPVRMAGCSPKLAALAMLYPVDDLMPGSSN